MGLAQTYKDFKRLKQIANILFKQEMGYFVGKLKLKSHLSFNKRLQAKKFLKPKDSMPKRLRCSMEELGGSFVKLGQLLSLRPDLIPKEYVDEFSKLQDSVKPFPFEKVKEIIESEFKKPINKVFSHFDKKPIASASVGQVHKAILKDGKRVAVKVQRPKIRELFETDIDLMYHLAHLIEKHIPESKNFNPTGIVGEFEKYTKKEMDYVLEGKNIYRYKDVIKNEKHIIVPEVYWDYTTSKVLTMEFIDGIKISSVKDFKKLKVRKSYLSNIIVRAFIKGVLYHRFFHADPHPGNILIMKNKNIALLDFGITGHLSPELAEKIGNLFFRMLKADTEGIIESFIDIGSMSEDVDKEQFKEDVRLIWGKYYDTTLGEVDMTRFFKDTLNLGRNYKMKFPVEYILLMKAMITTEGVIQKIDSSFNFVKVGKPIFHQYVKERKSPEYLFKTSKNTLLEFKKLLVRLPTDARKILTKIEKEEKEFDINDKDMKKFTYEIERSTNVLTSVIILATLVVASVLLIVAKVPPIVWGLPLYAIIGLILSGILLIVLMVSFLK
ncbi:MAG: AarF/ABC1/UbiB kinase family protein [Nanoarchaeota archaeon]|nr:AarF/ABC1/UbiB kinase family protein [Nanoarchaeota archaeon]